MEPRLAVSFFSVPPKACIGFQTSTKTDISGELWACVPFSRLPENIMRPRQGVCYCGHCCPRFDPATETMDVFEVHCASSNNPPFLRSQCHICLLCRLKNTADKFERSFLTWRPLQRLFHKRNRFFPVTN